MSNDSTINDGLLVKYLMNEADAAEVLEVHAWLENNTEHQKYLNDLKVLWEESGKLIEGNEEEEESLAWNKLENRLNLNDQAVPKNRLNARWIGIAATILFISGIAWFGLHQFSKPEFIKIQSNAAVLNQTLPDGSEITLNKNSEITYPDSFKDKTRSVSLRGEAFFKVTPDKTKPFLIQVNNITVKVVGTSFNIKSRNGKTVVVVETGIVQVSKGKSHVELHPGERSTSTQEQNNLSKEKTQSRLYNYYRTNELDCDHTPLQELVDILNEIHHVDIQILNPALKNKEITANFKNQSLNEIIDVIKATFKAQVNYKNQQILIR